MSVTLNRNDADGLGNAPALGAAGPLQRECSTVSFRLGACRGWLAVVAMILSHSLPAGAGQSAPAEAGFPSNRLLHLRIEIPQAAMGSLREAPRNYVRATLRDGSNSLENVALRLKGRTGSFRGIDEKPSFTLDVARFVPGRLFSGMSRLHLNSSAEDPSFLNDWLGSELFRAADVPAPFVTHALVELNGRPLGLYVLKEGFAPEFLTRHFASADGNLYEPEPGPGADVTGPMRRSSGTGVDDHSDLQRLAAAATAKDLAVRSRELASTLDTNRFLTFLALEILLGHRDGYALARNNYRLYQNPGDGRFVFLPGGMDNLLGRANAPLQPRMAGTVAAAMMEIPGARRAYRERLGQLFTNQFHAERLGRAVRERVDLVSRELPRHEARALREPALILVRRIGERAADVARQLSVPEPAPLSFVADAAVLDGWRPVGVPTDGLMEEAAHGEVQALHIRAGTKTASSWRAQVWLPPGRYRFEARVRTRGVRPLPFTRGSGVYLRVPGQQAGSSTPLTGDHDWTFLRLEFALGAEERSLELQCVFRAQSGEAWFDRESLRLVRVGE